MKPNAKSKRTGGPQRGRHDDITSVREHRRKQDAPRGPGVRERGPDSGSGNLRPDKR